MHYSHMSKILIAAIQENEKGWIGVDFDGTLAVYKEFVSSTHTGNPIQPMVEFVKRLIANGVTVKIFSARACKEAAEFNSTEDVSAEEILKSAIAAVQDWCILHIGKKLEVTNIKTYTCIGLIDDRSVSVERNTGKILVNPDYLPEILKEVF